MTQPDLHPTPRPRDVLLEQVRAVGLSLRGPAAVAAPLAALATLMIATEILRRDHVIDFRPERWIVPGLLGLLLPFGVWKKEERFGAGLLWTLPVDRRRHALARAFAGWAWLMGAVLVFVLWLLALTLLSGGSVLADETVRLLPSAAAGVPGEVDAAALRTVRWTPRPLLWLAPFTAATAAYLLASAVALGPRHPLRWVAGTVLGFFLVSAVVSEAGLAAGAEEVALAPSRLLASLLYGPYGVEAFLVARTDWLRDLAKLSTGETVVVWRGLPDPGGWAAATLLWTGLGLAALWAAASRHRERRRA